MLKYSHLVSIKKEGDSLKIHVDRVFEGGRIDYCTDIPIGSGDEKNKWDHFDQISTDLGKFLCIDSPALREHLQLDLDEDTESTEK